VVWLKQTVSGSQIVVISGPVGAGKSTLARGLEETFGGLRLSTKDMLHDQAAERSVDLPSERAALQQFGTRLDAETGGRWVANAVARLIASEQLHEDPHSPRTQLVIVDAVRIQAQIDELRDALGPEVVHMHVYSSPQVLAERYESRGESSGLTELESYEQVAADPTERTVGELKRDADVAIDTQRSSERDVLIRAAAALRLLPAADERLVDVMVGAQYGSEGKGNIAFYLAGEYDLLIRVGGPNAGHTVPFGGGSYTHRLLPSGTLANQNAALVIGPGATLDVKLLQKEIADCSVEADRLSIDPQAMIIEQEDVQREKGMVAGIGSTGKGGGAAAARRILGRSRSNTDVDVRLAGEVPELAPYVRSTREILSEAYRYGKRILLEGTQGTALSLYHGHYPYVTSRDTTTSGTLAESGIGPRRVRRVLLVTRTYPIRVENPTGGTSGPMSQEITYEELATRSGIPESELRETERGSVTGSQRRLGEFDWDLLRTSVELNGATDVALTFTDYLGIGNRQARRFEQLTPDTIRFVEEVERVSGVSVSLLTTRFDIRSVIDRRRW